MPVRRGGRQRGRGGDDMTEEAILQRARALPCFTAVRAAEVLGGGKTNLNVRVTAAEGQFVVRGWRGRGSSRM